VINDSTSVPRWWQTLLWGLPPVTMMLAGLQHGTLFIDDAYITFRYAEQLAAGHGLVFNPGDPVLGTSTPLFAFILAGLKTVGISVLTAAHWLGLLSMTLVVVILQLLARRSVSLPVAAAVGMCVALHPDSAFVANSGMETAMSMALVFGGLLMGLRGRWCLAGGVGGAAYLMRPDGLLIVVIIAGLVWFRERNKLYQPLVVACLVVAPWVAYATVTYGSPLPHSIEAKQLIHPAVPSQILLGLSWLLTKSLPLKVFLGLGSIGAGIALFRRSELALVVLWMGAYTAGLTASGIAPKFPWYVAPLSIGFVLMAAFGAEQVAYWLRQRGTGHAQSWWSPRALVPAVLLLLATLCITDSEWRGFRTGLPGNEPSYLEIGALLQKRCAPGDVVFVGEVGVLSYMLMEQVIVDSAGINSPQISRFRAEDIESLRAAGVDVSEPEVAWNWVTRTIKVVKPAFIVTKYPWLSIGRVSELDWFEEQYKRIEFENGALAEYYAFELR
jgi:hypothetical protein